MEKNMILAEILGECRRFLPETFRQECEKLFAEHLGRLADTLLAFSTDGVPAEFPKPHFSVECTPPLASAFVFFEKPIAAWNSHGKTPEVLQQFADAMVQATAKHILMLMGQRFTPASLTDSRGIPPLTSELIASFTAVYGQNMTVGARAWTKHVHRSTEKFWGVVKGSVDQKNQDALNIVTHILDNRSWTNVFFHYMHEVVVEARVSTGHGARWGKGGNEFIGFLEPFDD